MQAGRKKKWGAYSIKEKAKLPKWCGHRRKSVFDLNKMRGNKAMMQYRRGYTKLWEVPECRAYMKKYTDLKEPGKYEHTNQHGGHMFSLPGDTVLTDAKAGRLMYMAITSKRLTLEELKAVRKMFSFLYQINGGKPAGNYDEVQAEWPHTRNKENIVPRKTPEQELTVPKPRELKNAFRQAWDKTKMSLVVWSMGLLATWFWAIFGARGTEDIKRIKNGCEHCISHREGYSWTKFDGGRAKLCGGKTREWRAYTVCLCPGGKHQPLPADTRYAMDNEGNPFYEPTWPVGCPVNAMSLILGMQERLDKKGVFRKMSTQKDKRGGRIGVQNYGDPVSQLALPWLKVQGCLEEFSHNAGRHALGRMMTKLKVPYRMTFQLCGDNPDVWIDHYQKDLYESGTLKSREQSRNHEVATAALRKVAEYFGLGLPLKRTVDSRDQILALIAKKLDLGPAAEAILSGKPVEDSESEAEDPQELYTFKAEPEERRSSRRVRRQPEARWCHAVEEMAEPQPKKKKKKRKRRRVKREPKEEPSIDVPPPLERVPPKIRNVIVKLEGSPVFESKVKKERKLKRKKRKRKRRRVVVKEEPDDEWMM